MGVILTSIMIFVAVVIIVVVVILLITHWKKFKKLDIERNLPIVENFMVEFTEGYRFGLETGVKETKSGRQICTYIPFDVHISDDEDDQEEVKPQTVIVGKDRRESFSTGDLSRRRGIVRYLPKTNGELTMKFKDSEFGKQISIEALYKNKMENLMKSVSEADKSIQFALEEYAGGEISKKVFEKTLTELRAVANKLGKEEKTKE